MISNPRSVGAPGNGRCHRRESGLAKESVINVFQAAIVKKTRLTQRIGALPTTLMQGVEAGVRLVLGL